jgi:hypothetical protein
MKRCADTFNWRCALALCGATSAPARPFELVSAPRPASSQRVLPDWGVGQRQPAKLLRARFLKIFERIVPALTSYGGLILLRAGYPERIERTSL